MLGKQFSLVWESQGSDLNFSYSRNFRLLLLSLSSPAVSLETIIKLKQNKMLHTIQYIVEGILLVNLN